MLYILFKYHLKEILTIKPSNKIKKQPVCNKIVSVDFKKINPLKETKTTLYIKRIQQSNMM